MSTVAGTIPDLKQVGPKKWRARVLVGYEPDPKGGYPVPIRKQKTFTGTKTEARNQLLTFVNTVNGTRSESQDRLDTFLARWLEYIAVNREPTTLRGYRSTVRSVNAKLGHIRLDRLDVQDIDQAYTQWRLEGVSAATIRKYHRVLAAALHQAWRWSLVPEIITKKVTPPPYRPKTRDAVPILVVRDLMTCADEMGFEALAALIALDSTTGLRRGELCGLRWSDLDLDAGTLKVERAVKACDGGTDRRAGRARNDGYVIGDVKTHLGRKLRLDGLAIAALRLHRDNVEKLAAQAGVGLCPEAFMFSLDPTGREWYSPDTVSHHFTLVCKRLGVKATLHGIRHTVATTLIAQGFDLRAVAARLGHADGTVTMKVYAHALVERDQAAADLLGRLVHGDASELAALSRGV